MIKSRIAFAGALVAVAGIASAGEFSATPTIASDYDWRGFSQTNPDLDGDFGSGFAYQLALNYGFDNGLYVGTWGSNVDFGGGKPDYEVDFYGGYAGGDSESGIGYDVGINFYTYPGAAHSSFAEGYAGISHGVFSGKLWYTTDYAGNSGNALYTEANVSYPLSTVSLDFHVGYSTGGGVKAVFGDNYLDYSVGVGYDINDFSLGLKFVSTDVSGYNDDKIVLSVSTTLPWGG